MRIKTINKVFFLLIFSSQLHASQLRGFCFPSHVSLDQVRHSLKKIELSTDKTSYRFSENCLEANLEDSRNGLYRAFLSSKFPILRSYSNSLGISASNENCKIDFITQESLAKKTKVRRVGNKVVLKDLMNNSAKTRKSSLLVTPGHFAYIDVNDHSVGISCSPRVNNLVVLGVNLRSSHQNLSTKVTIKKGQRLNLGDVVEDLSSKSREVSLNRGLNKKKIKGQKSSKYFLIVN